jgi:hypothetical protein
MTHPSFWSFATCSLVLRQQINVLRRKSPKRFAFGNFDRLVLVGLYRLKPHP